MINRFQEGEFDVAYPENWKLVESSSDAAQQFSIESPNSCVWDLYRFEDADTSEQWLQSFIDTFAEQYDIFEQEPIQFELGDQSIDAVEANFYCLNLLISAYIFEMPSEDSSRRVIMYQGESREFEDNLTVFHAITMSYLNRK